MVTKQHVVVKLAFGCTQVIIGMNIWQNGQLDVYPFHKMYGEENQNAHGEEFCYCFHSKSSATLIDTVDLQWKIGQTVFHLMRFLIFLHLK